ncbi:MAG: pseudouridine synthase [Bifidobacterium sp.]|uniref:RNA pseudouridylate synthase n=1 Tax=Bifidobacterium fermentum TaxID=3059035 RepID=A0AB39UK41_9BIFI
METLEKRHRWVTDEPTIPFPLRILYQNDAIVAVDKPHFLPTTPRGMWYRSTALMRLREMFHNDQITPAHRLDRATAGVVLFVSRPELRGAYQMLFQHHQVRKSYECIAPARPVQRPHFGTVQPLDVPSVFPLKRMSRITKHRGILQAFESSGTANSTTIIELSDNQDAVLAANEHLLSTRGEVAAHQLYRVYSLRPLTGKTHQLRVHMNSIGLPIAGDDLYPSIRMHANADGTAAPDDFAHPLQLVARSLEFIDPISNELRRFESEIPLEIRDETTFSAIPAPKSVRQARRE